MTTQPEKRDLLISRVLNAPIEQVWQAWTDASYVMQWWGPQGFTSPLAKMDVQVGWKSLVCMSSPEHGEHYSTWHYTAIEPNQRIEYIHNLADKDGNTVDPKALGFPPDFPTDQRHEIIFKSLGADQTELIITEYDWTVGQMMEFSEMGMNQCLDKMEKALQKR